MSSKLSAFIFTSTLLFTLWASPLFAQKKKDKKEKKTAEQAMTASDTLNFTTTEDFKPTLEINPGALEEEKKIKKKKRKKKVFFGMKTKVRYYKDVQRNNVIMYKFHVLKEYKKPNPYVMDIFYYDEKNRRPASTSNYKPEYGMPLHGIFEKRVNGEIAEQGIFYVGTRHGRWEKYGREQALLDKKKYYRGFPKESVVSYYDIQQEKVKEVVPIHYGKKEGWYLRYYESGRLAEAGRYVDDIKVGTWWEYYDRERGPEKKETQYKNPNRPYEDDFEPYVLREWDEQGKKIVDNRDRRRGR